MQDKDRTAIEADLIMLEKYSGLAAALLYKGELGAVRDYVADAQVLLTRIKARLDEVGK